MAVMGDTAEAAFLELHPEAHRLGLSRPAFAVQATPVNLRYAPDFALQTGAYEVMGFSSRGNKCLKLKLEKARSLMSWALLVPTYLWVWDSAKRRYWEAPIDYWIDACDRNAERLFFEDNLKPYWNLGLEHFPCEPTSVTAAA